MNWKPESEYRAEIVNLKQCRDNAWREAKFQGDVASKLGRQNTKLIAGCDKAEELIKAGGYMKWQDGAWWIFWESSGDVAAGPAMSLYDLALILSNAEVSHT